MSCWLMSTSNGAARPTLLKSSLAVCCACAAVEPSSAPTAMASTRFMPLLMLPLKTLAVAKPEDGKSKRAPASPARRPRCHKKPLRLLGLGQEQVANLDARREAGQRQRTRREFLALRVLLATGRAMAPH